MTIRARAARSAIALALGGVALPAVAQTTAPQDAPPPSVPAQQQQQPIPGLNDYRFSLPSNAPQPQVAPTPTPAPAPTPSATPTSTPTPTRAAAVTRAQPAVTATPTPRPTPTAAPTRAEPRPATTDAPQPVPTETAAVSVATPTPALPAAVAQPLSTNASPWPLWGAALLVVLGLGAAWAIRRGRRFPAEEAVTPLETAPVHPAAADVVEAAPPAPAATPRLSLAMAPRRAGLNLISATAEAELIVRNEGDAPAEAIRIGATLLEAGRGQESAVAGFFAEPVARPAAAPFGLAPGEERRVRIVVARPRDAIHGVPAGRRAMFVPVVAVNALHRHGDDAGQSARAFALGVELPGETKLAPFWLDQPPRMYDGLAVRPYGPVVER